MILKMTTSWIKMFTVHVMYSTDQTLYQPVLYHSAEYCKVQWCAYISNICWTLYAMPSPSAVHALVSTSAFINLTAKYRCDWSLEAALSPLNFTPSGLAFRPFWVTTQINIVCKHFPRYPCPHRLMLNMHLNIAWQNPLTISLGSHMEHKQNKIPPKRVVTPPQPHFILKNKIK